MTVISLSDKATTPAEVSAELRSMADFVEQLAAVGKAEVTVTGELNITVDYRRPEPEPDWRKAPDWNKVEAS